MSDKKNFFSLFLCFLLLCFLSIVLFFNGCSISNNTSQFLLFSNLPSQKINNISDLTGDRKSELVFWNTSSMSSTTKFLELCFFEILDLAKNKHSLLKLGDISDIPFVGYFDDDSLLDIGVYRRDTGEWVIKSGAKEDRYTVRLGGENDLPVPNDYDGDEKYDFVVYTPSTSTFKGILSRSKIPFQFAFGVMGDIPVPKDYDGDGKSDFATYRPVSGIWTIKRSSDSKVSEVVLGGSYYLPIPADYDGDGKSDLCVFNIINKQIELLFSQSGMKFSDASSEKIKNALQGTDAFPVQLDYSGDGRCELAFWDSLRKLLITFNLSDELRKKVYHFANMRNSFPVNNFLLRNLAASGLRLNPVKVIHGRERLVFLTPRGITSFPIKGSEKKNTIPFIADFDGDYIDDSCFWSQDTGTFLCTSSRVGWDFGLKLGERLDNPFIGNFNSDNITDIGSYREQSMTFYYRLLGKKSPKEVQIVTLSKESGKNGVPQIGDYDGDNIDDLAVYNHDEKLFVVRKSSDLSEVKYSFCSGSNCKTLSLLPITCDFDGDNKTDPGVVNVNNGTFNYFSTYYSKYFNKILSGGISSNVFCADMDFDLRSDLVFFNVHENLFWVYGSKTDFNPLSVKLPSYKYEDIKLVNCPWLYNSLELRAEK